MSSIKTLNICRLGFLLMVFGRMRWKKGFKSRFHKKLEEIEEKRKEAERKKSEQESITKIENYVKSALDLHADPHLVRRKLRDAGWDETYIEHAFRKYEKTLPEEPEEKVKDFIAESCKKDILKIVDEKQKVSLTEMAEIMGSTEEQVQKWTEELDEKDFLDITIEDKKLYLISTKLEKEKFLEELEKEEPELSREIEYVKNLEKLGDLVNEKGRISLEEAADILKLPKDLVERHANYLKNSETIDVEYSLGTTFLTKKVAEAEKKSKRKPLKEKQKRMR